MRTTTLGTGGPEVGVIGLGCMGMSFAYDLAADRDEATSVDVIRQAIDAGMTVIDTADVYGPYTNEELVGRALADGYRDRAFLATKVGLVAEGRGFRKDNSPEHIRSSIDASLQRLGTDHVDLYQLHRVDREIPLEETWGVMAELVEAGKVRHLGLSDVRVEQIQTAHAVHPVRTVESELSLWTRDGLADVIPFCAEQGIGYLAYAPLGRGFLTGRFTSRDDIPRKDARRGMPRFQEDTLEANVAIVERVRAIADRLGVSPAQVAIAWVLTRGDHIVPIPGTKTPKYLADNAAAADLVLSDEDVAELDALPTPEGARH